MFITSLFVRACIIKRILEKRTFSTSIRDVFIGTQSVTENKFQEEDDDDDDDDAQEVTFDEQTKANKKEKLSPITCCETKELSQPMMPFYDCVIRHRTLLANANCFVFN